MKTSKLFLCLFLLLPAIARDLPSDPRIRRGQLENGVRWMYEQHNNPPGKMALQVHVRTGSLNETDEQRGLAHFIEHMGFNGTEHFAPGKLVPYFESIGMEFGPHLNAFTDFGQTVYMLFTPNTEKEQVDKALMVLSDYVFRDSLTEEEINKERGIILEEARSGKSAGQRIRDKLWPELFEGSRFARRLPIGDETVIAKAPRKEFADYYKTWYRPENVTVVLVGDAPPDEYVPLIKKWFGEVKSSGAAPAEKKPEFKPFTHDRAIVVTDPEMAYCQIQMMNILAGRPPTITTEQWRTELVEGIAGWIIGRRFDDRVKLGQASYRRAAASVDAFYNDAVLVTGFALGEARDWPAMLTELISEIHRGRENGFTERELALARKELLAAAERAVRTEGTRNAREIISQIVHDVNEKTPTIPAKEELELYKQFLPEVSLAEVNGTFKRYFTPGKFAYVVTMANKEGTVVPAREEVLAKAQAAWKAELTKIADDAGATNILERLPEPGKLGEMTADKDLGITHAWLDNGIRVHHRFMDYKKDSVLVSIALAGGVLEETSADVGVTQVAALAINEAATRRIPSTRMRDLMTGKNINVGAGPAGDNFAITISGSPADLEAGLQETYALLTDGIIEEAAFKNWKLSSLLRLEQSEKLPAYRASEAMEDLLSGSDPRRLRLGRTQIESLTAAKAQQWFNRLRKEAPIEVAVVGDISWEQTVPLLEKYLGSLPKRPRDAAYLDRLRKSPRPPGPLERIVKVETVTPQAVAYGGFAASEGKNTPDSRALELASNILSSRLVKRVREELAIVYSISAYSSPSWIYEDAGRFVSGAPCDPANSARVLDELHKAFKDFADKGPTDEELANAKKQIANNLDTGMREPGYWWSILRNYDLRKRDLEVEKGVREAFEKITAEQVAAVFRKYYTPARQFRVSAIPYKAEK